jgi:hypothetical protein
MEDLNADALGSIPPVWSAAYAVLNGGPRHLKNLRLQTNVVARNRLLNDAKERAFGRPKQLR